MRQDSEGRQVGLIARLTDAGACKRHDVVQAAGMGAVGADLADKQTGRHLHAGLVTFGQTYGFTGLAPLVPCGRLQVCRSGTAFETRAGAVVNRLQKGEKLFDVVSHLSTSFHPPLFPQYGSEFLAG